jgi:hypothetical protein
MLVAGVEVLLLVIKGQVALAAAETAAKAILAPRQLLELQTQAVVEVVLGLQLQLLEVQVLSSFHTQTLIMYPHL